jgi:hypothetical protein
MGLRDRFYTPATARAILSWRIIVGVGVAVILGVAGVPIAGVVAAGLAIYAGLVYVAMPKAVQRPRIDAFAVGEPWRQYVQGAQRAAAKLHQTVRVSASGPVRERLDTIATKLDHGLDETWRIARRGDEIDNAVGRLDPTRLRSKLATLELEAADDPNDQLAAAIESVRSQLESTDRLKERSANTANTLRLTQTRLDELTARATEVSIGAGDTDAYEHDVEDLVDELEGLRLALDETR